MENFLGSCQQGLLRKGRRGWQRAFAVDPFAGARPPSQVSIVIAVRMRRPWPHLLAAGEAFADAFLEFGILPDVYLEQPEVLDSLRDQHPQRWDRVMTRARELKVRHW